MINHQKPLLFQTSDCVRCPLHKDNKCEGAITLESFVMETKSVIGCRNVERISVFYTDLKRSVRKTPPSNKINTLCLPPYIPVIQTGAPKNTKLNTKLLYGVSFSSLLNKDGTLRYRTPESLRLALRLPSNGRLALFCTVDDLRIENFWKISESKELWQRIATLNFEFVTSATFSVYAQHPRSDQVINQIRNFVTLDNLSALNIPAVPFIFFNPESELDYINLLKELDKRKEIDKIAILAQLRRSEKEFSSLIDSMIAIKKDLNRELSYIVVGVAEPKRIKQIFSKFPKSTIVNSQPFMKANRCGQETLPDLSHRKSVNLTRTYLIENNLNMFVSYCNEVILALKN